MHGFRLLVVELDDPLVLFICFSVVQRVHPSNMETV